MPPDTLRDPLRRLAARSSAQVQRLGVWARNARQPVRAQVYAIDGSGLGANRAFTAARRL